MPPRVVRLARVLVVADPPRADIVRLTLNHGVYTVRSIGKDRVLVTP